MASILTVEISQPGEPVINGRDESMSEIPVDTVDYGNWVPKRLVIISGVIGLVFVILALFLPLLFVLAAFFLLSAVYFAYAYYMFSFPGQISWQK